MSRWFRVYDDMIDDPKVQKLSGDMFKALVNLWCLASKNDGYLPPMDEVVFKLRMRADKVAKIIAHLTACGLLDGGDQTEIEPHNWASRQFKSDVSNERVKRHRERKCNVTSTVTVTPPETEDRKTEQKDSEPRGSAPTDLFTGEVEIVNEDPNAKLFREGLVILESFGVSEKRARPLLGQWKKSCHDPTGLLAAIRFARQENVIEPIAYISKVISQGKSNGRQQAGGDLARELADETRRLEAAAGIGRQAAAV
jgi:hypothetical protein